MDDRINRIEDKVDKIIEKMAETNVILASQHESLVIHMKRSDLLEKKIEPVEKHVAMMQGAIKLVMLLGVMGSIISVVLKLSKVI